jgi:hypothetical protein
VGLISDWQVQLNLDIEVLTCGTQDQGDQMFLLKNRPKTMKSRPTMFLLNHWAIFSRKKSPNAIKKSPKWRNFAQSGHPAQDFVVIWRYAWDQWYKTFFYHGVDLIKLLAINLLALICKLDRFIEKQQILLVLVNGPAYKKEQVNLHPNSFTTSTPGACTIKHFTVVIVTLLK